MALQHGRKTAGHRYTDEGRGSARGMRQESPGTDVLLNREDLLSAPGSAAF